MDALKTTWRLSHVVAKLGCAALRSRGEWVWGGCALEGGAPREGGRSCVTHPSSTSSTWRARASAPCPSAAARAPRVSPPATRCLDLARPGRVCHLWRFILSENLTPFSLKDRGKDKRLQRRPAVSWGVGARHYRQIETLGDANQRGRTFGAESAGTPQRPLAASRRQMDIGYLLCQSNLV